MQLTREADFRMSARSAPLATALLLAVCAGLGAAVVFELSGALPIAPQVTAAPPQSPAPDWVHQPIVFEPPTRGQLDVIAARPLFSPSRRPFVGAPAQGSAEAAADLPPLELIGVLLTDQRRAALIRPLDGRAPGWMREDEMVAGWRLERIERGRVHLRAGDRLEVVELRADTAVPPGTRTERRKAATERRKAATEEQSEAATEEQSEPAGRDAEGASDAAGATRRAEVKADKRASD
jgi:hypothetical protein